MNPLGVHALVFVSGWSQKEAARARSTVPRPPAISIWRYR